jgi:hypothetical protein
MIVVETLLVRPPVHNFLQFESRKAKIKVAWSPKTSNLEL